MSTVPTPPSLVPPITEPVLQSDPECVPNYDDLVTEDHKPVDRILTEKLYRLLTHTLYANWPGPGDGRPFLVLANVGWFFKEKTPPVVPDCLLSLGVACPDDLHVKQGHSYYSWRVGKPPDVVIECVSDRTGGEDSDKFHLYASLGVPYYAIFDSEHYLTRETVRTFELSGGVYHSVESGPWPAVGLGLRLWQGKFEGHFDTWLRWCDARGEIIPTGEESAALMKERARQAEDEARRAENDARQAADEARRAADEARRAADEAKRATDEAKRATDRAAQAEERNRKLEEELRRLRGEQPSS